MGDKAGIAALLNNLGIIAYEQGDYVASPRLHEEGLGLRQLRRNNYTTHLVTSVLYES
jgi:hypothetical protein